MPIVDEQDKVVVSGFCVSAFDTYYLLTTDLSPTVVGHSIQYGTGAATARMTYGAVSLLPLFLTSIPKLWILGALSLMMFLIVELFFPLTFISVWCILAAVSSAAIPRNGCRLGDFVDYRSFTKARSSVL